MNEEERLNGEIRKAEAEIDALYAEIGREYYEKNTEIPQDEEMAVRFREIGEKKEKIQDINDQIRSLKGITKCEQCGADVLVSDTFCPNCGCRIISEVKISPVGGKCPSCGHEVKPGQLFCTTCGAKVTVSEDILPDDIESEETRIFETNTKSNLPTDPFETEEIEWNDFEVPEPENEEEPESKPEPERTASAKKLRCPNCGEELESGMRFCIFCGSPLDAPAHADDEQSSQQSEKQRPTRCPNCGEPLEPGDMFCVNCGTKIE